MSNFKYPLLAKPSGITLDQHTKNVMSEGEYYLIKTPFIAQKYNEQIGKSLSKRLELVCKYHDIGKRAMKWQTACQKDYETFLTWHAIHGDSYKNFSKTEKSGENLRKADIRHELQSLRLIERKKMPISLQAAIAAHHNKLSLKHENRWINENMTDLWNVFRKESNRIIEQYSLEKTATAHYEFAGPRGLLQLIDHRASAKEEGDYVPDFSMFHYKFPHETKKGVQKLIENHWEDNLLLVRAPTGAGKTDASLLWASLQIKNNKADRLIIAMPTRFTSNALAINVAESLSETGLYHSSAWFTKFQEQIEANKIEKQKASKLHEFARLLQTPITVCTIDHLLIALTLTREDHHLIAFNMANSCLVIDEADFYDDFTQANILVLLEILRYWKVPVLLMSASLPQSVLPAYRRIGYQINKIIEDTSDNSRDRFEIKTIQDYTNLSEIEHLLELCLEKENAIIYANTVDSAVKFYNWFAEKKANAILYHSRFTEPDKMEKEKELINALGKQAWKDKQAHGIAIMTQIGEMSINISADIMISELCPIDRLTQRAGRLCRFDDSQIGELFIIIPQKNDSDYPAPYGDYNNRIKEWIPCDAFVKTKEILQTAFYSAEKLVQIINDIYSEETSFSSKAISNANELKEYFQFNWLINPIQIINTDDSETNFWRSRNIPPQDIVYTMKPERKNLYNYLSFQEWKLKHSIELPVYLIEKARKQHIIDVLPIKIKEEEDTINIIREDFYNSAKGITFMEDVNLF